MVYFECFGLLKVEIIIFSMEMMSFNRFMRMAGMEFCDMVYYVAKWSFVSCFNTLFCDFLQNYD